MLRSGAAVALWDIDSARLENAESQLAAHGRVSAFPIDLTQEQQVGRAVQETVQALGSLDILVNNAGITGGNAPAWELDPVT
jgi:3-oxoacyl-[acyl-carrier protein] reductase